MSNNSGEEEVDWLSELPEKLFLEILSFLPAKCAARTSLLSRHFRDAWTKAPSIELNHSDFAPHSLFNNKAFCCLGRPFSSSSPLLRLCLRTNSSNQPFAENSLINWLNRAFYLGIRDLELHIHTESIESLFPIIVGHDLRSLFIEAVDLDINPDIISFEPVLPATFCLTGLHNLHFKAELWTSELKRFVMAQTGLQYLCVEPHRSCHVDLYSQSGKMLKFGSQFEYPQICLCFPRLEFLDLRISTGLKLKEFQGEMPILKEAAVKILLLHEDCVPVLCDILTSVANVSKLILEIRAPYPKPRSEATPGQDDFDLFHPLLGPGKGKLIFPNLRSLKISMCFSEKAIQDLIFLLRQSPVIDSLHLIHVDPPSDWQSVPEDWHSQLPQNSEGNRRYADFANLQTGDKKSEVIKLLSGDKPPKKMKT